MSRRSYKPLTDPPTAAAATAAAAAPAASTRRTRASRSNTANSTLILGLTTNVGELAKSCAKLERSLVRLGTGSDNVGFRQRLQDDQHDTTVLVKSTIESLAAAQPLLDAVQYKRLSLQFEQTYKKYTALAKQIDDKQKQLISHSHTHTTHSHDTPATGRHTNNSTSSRYNDHTDAADYYGATAGQQERRQEQQYDDESDVVFTEMEHEEVVRRVEEIKQIEGEVAEVAQLYKDLHVLVNEQQEGIDVISERVEVVQHKVEQGHEQLVRASNNQRSARNLKCWTALIVLIVIALAIVVVLVLKKTNVF